MDRRLPVLLPSGLALGTVFPRDLAAAAPFRTALEKAYARLGSPGVALT
mgnify:CR=1 FL=1